MLNIHHCFCAVPAQTKAELSAGLPFRVEYGELEAGLLSGGSSTDVRVDTLNQPININKPRALNVEVGLPSSHLPRLFLGPFGLRFAVMAPQTWSMVPFPFPWEN